MAKSVDSNQEQTDLHCLPRPVCWNTQEHYGICYWALSVIISEQTHVILALFVLHKFILQTHTCRHPVGLDV